MLGTRTGWGVIENM